MLVSPAEPPAVFSGLRAALADVPDVRVRSSSLPERRYGLDFLWQARGALFGAQRKTVPADFLASLRDGRLADVTRKSIPILARGPGHVFLILEGAWDWTTDGALVHGYAASFSRVGFRALLASFALRGISTLWSDDEADTGELIAALVKWSRKARHDALDRRIGERIPALATARARRRAEWSHALQGLPRCGPETAEAVLDTFGRPPIKWDFPWVESGDLKATSKTLQRVPGVGKLTANVWAKFWNEEESP